LHVFTPSHTRTHTHTLSRTTLNEGSALRSDLYQTTHAVYKRETSIPQRGSNSQSKQARGRRTTP